MIIVTGASRGIGQYLFDQYCPSEDIIGTYNNNSSPGKRNNLFKVDITNPENIKDFIAEVSSSLKNITLINCAGINYNSFAHKADLTKWSEVINVNLLGTFYMISSLLPYMRDQNYGRIINFGSVVSELPSPGISAYAASKSALFGMTKSIAAENALRGITINNINLGYSELGMIKEVPENFLETVINRIPSNQLCKKEDIFSTVEYLRGTEYVNGANINLNGGLI
ncbi:MAG TPA: SDR family NAD(P)-dependent oxidoreductase [Sphingobacteriaceae bacterium]